MTAARGGERVGEKKREERKEECPPACLHLNPFKEIKGFQSSFFPPCSVCLFASNPTADQGVLSRLWDTPL